MTIELGQQAVEALNALQEQATLRDLTLEKYLQLLASAGANGSVGSTLTSSEVEQFLDELSTGPTLPILPSDFSRNDIYAEHD